MSIRQNADASRRIRKSDAAVHFHYAEFTLLIATQFA
jgi:hypothetical protein